MRALIVALAALCLMGCSQRNSKVEQVLRADGYTNIKVTGWRPFAGCSDKDKFSDRFIADKNGQRVVGVVCAGWIKGSTIRVIDATTIDRP